MEMLGQAERQPLSPDEISKIFERMEQIKQSLAKIEANPVPNKEASGLIDTPQAVADFVDILPDLPISPPSLYVDLEGIHLCRYGSISILQVFVLPKNQAYLIDIHTLGSAAFTTPSRSGNTLKTVLECPRTPKAFFDVRNDSDALFAHFGIKLAGVCDIQLMELATRQGYKKYVNGLVKCMDRDLAMTALERTELLATKEAGKKLFAPELGGSYEVFNIRPLPDAVRQYCLQDVRYLPRLWQKYAGKMSPAWAKKVEVATRARVALSQSKTYVPKGPHKALGPW